MEVQYGQRNAACDSVGGTTIKKRISRVSDEELFARLIYYGVTQLKRHEPDVWLMPLGGLMDQIEIDKQFNGLIKPKSEVFIDEVLPQGI